MIFNSDFFKFLFIFKSKINICINCWLYVYMDYIDYFNDKYDYENNYC